MSKRMGMKLPQNLRQKLDKCWIQDTAGTFLCVLVFQAVGCQPVF